MIHSMSGGVIKKYEKKTLVKVMINDTAFWYACSVPVFQGDKAKVEFDNEETVGEVIEVKTQVTADCSPVPFGQIKEVLEIIENY